MSASGHDVTEYEFNSTYSRLPAIGATAVNDVDWGFAVGPGTTSFAFGQAGRDVTGLSFKPLAGKTVTATVQDGFWSAWWPPRRSYGDVGATVTWTTVDGASHTANLMSIPTYGEKLTTGNGKPSAIPVSPRA